jgi:hypothetical protein
MKTANWMMMFLLAGALALAGCGKQAKPVASVADGVTVDVPKLREAFATAAPEVQTSVNEVVQGIRYTDYPRCFAALDKLGAAPGITEPQKKILSQVTEQLKQAAGKAAAPPTQ